MTEEKKGISKGAVRTIIAIVVAIHMVALLANGCEGASLKMRSIEEYAEKNEACNADNPPAVRDAWIKEATTIIAAVPELDSDDVVGIDEAFPLFRNKGAKAVTALKKKWVKFPNIEDTLLATDAAIGVMEHYKKDGVDLTQEYAVDTGLKGTCGFPILLPKHFWEKIQEAAQAAQLKEIRISWGLRDSNLQAIMFVRSVFSACGEYPSSASQGCMKKVARGIAGKPGKIGFTHFFSADIDNWFQMKKELLERGFACGCSGVGEKDERHTTWSMPQREAKAKCQVMTWLKRIF